MATLAQLANIWRNGGGGLPKPLAGTGGVRSPAGPYGPPGFIDGPIRLPPGMPGGAPGSVPIGSEQPFPSNSTTGGVGTTMQPNTGGLEPAPYGGMGSPAPTNGLPPQLAGTGGVKSPYGPYGPPGFIGGGNDRLSPAQSAQWQAAVGNSPWRGLMPNQGQYPTGHGNGPGPASGGGEGYVSPLAAMRQAAQNGPGTFAQNRSAYIGDARGNTWDNPDWRMQQVIGGKIAPTNNAELQAMIAQMSPADRQAYIDRYKSIGLDVTYQGGGGSGPFGNGIAS